MWLWNSPAAARAAAAAGAASARGAPAAAAAAAPGGGLVRGPLRGGDALVDGDFVIALEMGEIERECFVLTK